MTAALPILMIAGLAATAVGGVVSAVGAMQEGEANAKAAEDRADTAQVNKIIADQDRRYASRTAQIDAADTRRENRRTLASIRAAFGASGGDLAGSPIEVLEDTATELEVGTQRIEQEGRMQKRTGALQMLGYQRESEAELRTAGNARTAGGLNAFGAILNTGSRLTRFA